MKRMRREKNERMDDKLLFDVLFDPLMNKYEAVINEILNKTKIKHFKSRESTRNVTDKVVCFSNISLRS